jgi:hypothetical protein
MHKGLDKDLCHAAVRSSTGLASSLPSRPRPRGRRGNINARARRGLWGERIGPAADVADADAIWDEIDSE